MPARSSPKSAGCLTSTRSAQRTSMSRKVTPKARLSSKLRPETGCAEGATSRVARGRRSARIHDNYLGKTAVRKLVEENFLQGGATDDANGGRCPRRCARTDRGSTDLRLDWRF